MTVHDHYVKLVYEAAGSDEAEVCGYIENLKDPELRKALQHILKINRSKLLGKLRRLAENESATQPPVPGVSIHTGPPIEGD